MKHRFDEVIKRTKANCVNCFRYGNNISKLADRVLKEGGRGYIEQVFERVLSTLNFFLK